MSVTEKQVDTILSVIFKNISFGDISVKKIKSHHLAIVAKRTTASSSCSLHSSFVVNIDLSLSLILYTPISVLMSNYFSWIALCPFFLSILMFTGLLLSPSLPFLPPLCSSIPSPHPSPPPVCDGSFSWRCCSTASVCPACCANPPPHQALGPSTHTKYFYLFIQFHGLPGGNLRLDRS